MTGWNTEHDASRTMLAAIAHVEADNMQREFDGNLSSISASIEGSLAENTASRQV
jgi:hypothetical protein